MTALERLIKLASTDGAAHYRELAKEAQEEYLNFLRMQGHYLALVDEKLEHAHPKSSCTPTNPVAN